MVERRFDSNVNSYMFSSKRDFLGKGEMGTVVRAYKHGNLTQKPVALKIVRKEKLTGHKGKFKKWMCREIKVHEKLTQLFADDFAMTSSVVKLY